MTAVAVHLDARAAQHAPAAAPAVRAVGLAKEIDDRLILRALHFDIPVGSCTALLGANGAGKSTLLRILAMLLHPTAGKLELFGQTLGPDATALRYRLGMVGHAPMLYRDLSARENLAFFAKLYGVPQPDRRALQMLELVGLADRADDPVKAFSRGMTQRVSIARALMHEPELFLADEPFAGLDAPSSAKLETLFGQLLQRGKTIVFTNHDVAQSLRLAQRLIVLQRGQVVLEGTAAQYDAADVLRKVAAA